MQQFCLILFRAAILGAIPIFGLCSASDDTGFSAFVADVSADFERAVDNGQVPGAAVAIVDRDGVLWQSTFGHHPNDSERSITSETIFSLQSISKNYTAVAVMLAVQEGKLDLDVPIKSYLPDFKVNTPFPENPMEMITLRHLLSHTAGFTHEAPVGNNFNAASPSFDAHVASIAETWLRFPVGSRYAYSNLGIDLAGFILQEVAGIPFETYLQKRLLNPIGADQGFVDTPVHHGKCAQCTGGHHPLFTELPDYIPLTASGGVRASLDDAAHYVRFHLNRGTVDGRQLIAPELLDEIYRPTHREPAFGDHTVFPEHLYHGMGTYSFKEADTYGIGHTGGGFGFTASMRWLPEYGVGKVILYNSGADPLAHLELGWDMLARMIESGLVERLEGIKQSKAAASFAAIPRSAPNGNDQPKIPGEKAVAEGRLLEAQGVHRPVFDGGFKLKDSIEQCLDCIKIEKLDGKVVIHHGLPEPESLIRHAEGLYFAKRSGELLDLRKDLPVWRSIAYRPLERAD